MLIKILILLMLLGILSSLGVGLFRLVKDEPQSKSKGVLKALTWRISLSVILFILLMLAGALGLITPHSVDNYKPRNFTTAPYP